MDFINPRNREEAAHEKKKASGTSLMSGKL
jgi:hypothetical protein